MTLRCISFVAVSSSKQAEEVSLDEQRAINARNAHELGGYVAHALAVPGHTREYDTLFEIMADVPAYRQMWDLIRNREADVLLAYTADRLARTESLLLDLARKCWRHGVALYIDNLRPQSLDPHKQAKDLTQKLLLAIAGVQSSDEVVKLRERHIFGMRSRAEDKGRMPGKIPYGYKPEVRGTEVYAVPDPETQPIVRWLLLDLYAGERLSLHACADRLNVAGCVSPGTRRRQVYPEEKTQGARSWTRTTVRNIVDRAEVYGGYISYNRRSRRGVGRHHILAPGQHEGLISEEELGRVLVEREQRERGPRRVFAFSGVGRCAECDCPMKMNSAPGPHYEYKYLRCAKCGRHVREETVERYVREFLSYTEAVTQAINRAAMRRHEEAERIETDIAFLQEQIQEIDRTINNLLDLAEAGAEVAELVARIKQRKQDRQRIESEVQLLRQQMTRLHVPQETDVEAVRAEGLAVLNWIETEPARVRAWFIANGIKIWVGRAQVEVEME